MPLETGRYRLMGSRSTLAYINAQAPKAAALVADHFGRRPLAVTEIVLTTPGGLLQLFTSTQAAAANIPQDKADQTADLLRAKPRQLYSTTGLRPGKGGGTVTLINARRNKTARDLDETLLYELVAVDQMGRSKARERWIAALRDVSGVQTQPPRMRRAMDKATAADDAEAARVVKQLQQRLRAA
ncbi:hypothetical protein M8I34_32345 [Streptomyces sp. MCA2]|uniref:hypothetical protein n=1 Tax=Streptomyces sp. MCA2 TaxID=2944805 RepID=UPI0020206AA5|nr:hypothetical protein [Streptomyces sp. MCA2]MCL7496060.1 hypothetical protein [Streptomyces sp. MCA2]